MLAATETCSSAGFKGFSMLLTIPLNLLNRCLPPFRSLPNSGDDTLSKLLREVDADAIAETENGGGWDGFFAFSPNPP
jgi:hypothetical protein